MAEGTKSNNQSENDIQLEIQNTLSEINDITIKVKQELDYINWLMAENGELESTVKEAKEFLTKKAKEELINVEDVLTNFGKTTGLENGIASSEEMTTRIMTLMGTDKL